MRWFKNWIRKIVREEIAAANRELAEKVRAEMTRMNTRRD